MREIVLDTETTGLDPATGDRIVEIGALELINHMPTGKQFHKYINPQRDMPEGAFAVHGLSEEFLSDKPLFAEIAQEFEDFIGSDILIIHNAPFDLKFLNSELARINRPVLLTERVIDTLVMARKKHPAAQNSLDALCKRYGVDNSMRDMHGALLDSELLAGVYLELIGGRQVSLSLSKRQVSKPEKLKINQQPVSARPNKLKSRLSKEEILAHQKLLESLSANNFWSTYSEN